MAKNHFPKTIDDICDAHSHHLIDLPREHLSLGQRTADKLTKIGGSWKFIFAVLAYITVWIVLNIVAFQLRWDPWPFILLNLTLNCLAALQAPVILMSQNRKSQKDRLRQQYDYLVNRKTEREAEKILTELEKIKRKLDELKR